MSMIDLQQTTDGLALANTELFNSPIQLRGRVKVEIEEGDQKWVHHIKDNIIVNLARETLCHLITAPQTTKHIRTFKIGTQGHSGNDILTPQAPAITNSDLNDRSAFSKSVSSFNLVGSPHKNQVDFSITLEKAEANNSGTSGKTYTEAGLYTADNKLFARETFPAIIKTNSRRITFTWSILF